MVKHRNLIVGAILTIVTFGIYGIYWLVSTKREIVSLGGEIPTSWLIIIPIANLYWTFMYCDAFSKNVKKDGNGVVYFLLFLFFFPVIPIIFQLELNKLAN